MSATVIAVTSDQHCGGTTALCPPRIRLDDGGEYTPSKAQRWLWANWLDFWKRAGTLCKLHNARLVQVFNGDLTEGEHHRSTQILSGNPTAQAAVVNEVMRVPLALEPDALFFIRGTETHVGISASSEERIALGLRKDKRPVVSEDATGNASHWHAKLTIGGVRLDFAHHGRSGQRPWTRPNIGNLLAFQIWTEHHLRNESPPHLAVRSHMHRFFDSGSTYPTRLIQTPAWQLATAYVHRILAEDALADVGGLILLIKNGILTAEPVLYRPTSPTPWSPT